MNHIFSRTRRYKRKNILSLKQWLRTTSKQMFWPSYFSTSVRVWEEIYSIVCTGYVPCQNGHLTVKSNVALLLEWVWQKYSRVTQDITDYNFENIDLHNDTYNYAWIETSSSYHLYFRNRLYRWIIIYFRKSTAWGNYNIHNPILHNNY